MIKFNHTRVMNFEGALRGLRNPLESWDKSDSDYFNLHAEGYNVGVTTGMCDRPLKHLGTHDATLALMLATAGNDHGKYLRQIMVSVDITAPLYWWKEFDTYKVATVANSTSTMHKLGSRHLVPEDFSFDNEDMEDTDTTYRTNFLAYFNELIDEWKDLNERLKKEISFGEKKRLERASKNIWRMLIQDLPSSFNQTRTVTLNYEVLRNIYHSDRYNHKQHEWRVGFINWIKTLPESKLIIAPRMAKTERQLRGNLVSLVDKIDKGEFDLGQVRNMLGVFLGLEEG